MMKRIFIVTFVFALLVGMVGVGTASAKPLAAPSTSHSVQPTLVSASASTPNNAKTYIVIDKANAALVEKRVVERSCWYFCENGIRIISYSRTYDYQVTVEGRLLEQQDNKPNPDTDPGVKNSEVTLKVEWKNSVHDEKTDTATVRTPVWSGPGSGSFKFHVEGKFISHFTAYNDLEDGVWRPTAQYKVDYTGYNWWGVEYKSATTGWKQLPTTFVKK